MGEGSIAAVPDFAVKWKGAQIDSVILNLHCAGDQPECAYRGYPLAQPAGSARCHQYQCPHQLLQGDYAFVWWMRR